MLPNLMHRGDDFYKFANRILFVFGHSGEYTPNFEVYNENAINFQQSENNTQTYTLGEI
jgi:hypothetical protein